MADSKRRYAHAMRVELPERKALVPRHELAGLMAEQLEPGDPGARIGWVMRLQKVENTPSGFPVRFKDGARVRLGTLLGGLQGLVGNTFVLSGDFGEWLAKEGYEIAFDGDAERKTESVRATTPRLTIEERQHEQRDVPLARVAWRRVLFENIAAIDAANGGRAKVMQVIAWLKTSGGDCIAGAGNSGELTVIDDNGSERKLERKTVSTAASDARRSRKRPA